MVEVSAMTSAMSPSTLSSLLPLFTVLSLVLSAVTTILPKLWMRATMDIAVPVLSSLAAFWVMFYVIESGPAGHGVGVFPSGISIPFLADTFSMLMLGVAAAMVAIGNWFVHVTGEDTSRFFLSLTLMMLAGMSGAFLTAGLFNFFVFMEVMLLPSYGLIAVTGTWHHLAVGRNFVLANLLTSTVLLIGATLVYGSAGNVNTVMLVDMASEGGPGGTGVVALGIVIVTLCVKAGLIPAHTWLSRVYPSTNPAVMALFSAMHTRVVVYMLFRIYVVIVGMNPLWHWPVIIIMAISMLVGTFAGLAENTMREVLAYQMVTGMPFILIVLAFTDANDGQGAKAALAAGVFYAIHHMMTVDALILGSDTVEETYGTGTLSRLPGLAHRDQAVAWVMAAMSFSIVGLPLSSGVRDKVGIVFTSAATGDVRSIVAITVIIVASLGSLLTMIRLWRAVFWGRPMQGVDDSVRVPGVLVVPSTVLAVVSMATFVAVGAVTWATIGAADALLNIDGYREATLDGAENTIEGIYWWSSCMLFAIPSG